MSVVTLLLSAPVAGATNALADGFPMTVWELISAVPGVLALVGAAMGYARLQQRMIAVEKDVEKVGEIEKKVAAIDERTAGQEKNIDHIRDQVDRLVIHQLRHGMSRSEDAESRRGS